MSGSVWRGLIVGAICILILPRCYKAIRRYRKASKKKNSSRPASRTDTQDSDIVASNEPESRPPPYANLIHEDGRPMLEAEYEEMAAAAAMHMHSPRMDSCSSNLSGVLINQAFAVVEFVLGGPNDSDSD
ncbi:Uncharacterized protein Rs2_50842 [Raphanus sativus]|nr:Uncharacterized protein Rs2_50842 [Raphanus sativus]